MIIIIKPTKCPSTGLYKCQSKQTSEGKED